MNSYYEDEDGVLRGVCSKHGEYVGDAIGCPECFAKSEDRKLYTTEAIKLRR